MKACNIHIEDSWKISKKDFKRILVTEYADSEVIAHRSLTSLYFEWCTHNFLYSIHMFRSHTKDVDLNWPQKWYITAVYCISGAVSSLLIR